ncbi:MAG: HD domain-containing protein [Candidatus Bathyarchaeota archaeon]|nr:HD domain-containing protein [Candidatus Bathyarchaeota archaeon]
MTKNSRLNRIITLIKNKNLRKKVAEIVENPKIEIGGMVYSGLLLETSPAGLSRHHSYPGGFIEHTIATAEIALKLCNVVKKIYGGKVNRDLVLAGVVLHDIFKPLTYEMEGEGYSTTHLGERLDHLTLITSELIRRDYPLDLVHIVCAHHGGQAGPMWPRTVEALICHLADQADSRLNGDVLRAARYLLRTATGEELTLMTSKEAFEIVHSKTVEGWEGVNKAIEKIKRKRRS